MNAQPAFDDLPVSSARDAARAALGYLNTLNACLAEGGASPNWPEALRAVSALAGSEAAALFLAEDDIRIRLAARWHDGHGPCPDFSDLRDLRLDAYPVLAGTLRMGMLVARDLIELPSAEYGLFARCGFTSMTTLPLLAARGTLLGFVALLSSRAGRALAPEEVMAINTAGRAIALALAHRSLTADLITARERADLLAVCSASLAMELTPEGSIIGVWGDSEPRRLLYLAPTEGGAIDTAVAPELRRILLLAAPRALAVAAGADAEFSLSDGRRERSFTAHLVAVPCTRRPGRRNVMALIRETTGAREQDATQASLISQLDLVSEPALTLAPDGRILRANPAWRAFAGAGEAASLTDCVPAGDRPLLVGMLASLMANPRAAETTHARFAAADGWLPARVQLRANRSSEGYARFVSVVIHPHARPSSDAAPNSAVVAESTVREAIRQSIARARRNQTAAVIGYGRIEGLQRIAGTLGMRAARDLAGTVFRRLRDTLRGADTLANCTEEEFALVASDLAGGGATNALMRRLRGVLETAVVLDGVEVPPQVRLGFAVYPEDADDPEGLLSSARRRLFESP